LQDPSITKLYRGKGCDLCNGSGYLGRTLVYEVLSIDKELSRLINEETELSAITDKAKNSGFVDIFDVTAAKVKEGSTTAEEAIRVLGHIRYDHSRPRKAQAGRSVESSPIRRVS
jgi:type IV pilus assembly protein PilB